MLSLLWNFSAAIRGYLRSYMPTNIAIDLLRSRRGLKWVIPVALVASPAYLFAMSSCAQLATHPGLGWLNVLVLLFFWNAMKFTWLALFSPLMLLRRLPEEPSWGRGAHPDTTRDLHGSGALGTASLPESGTEHMGVHLTRGHVDHWATVAARANRARKERAS